MNAILGQPIYTNNKYKPRKKRVKNVEVMSKISTSEIMLQGVLVLGQNINAQELLMTFLERISVLPVPG